MSLTNTIKDNFVFPKMESNALCILDGDGEPRWIWPKHANRPLFLQLYQATTLRQKLFGFLINLVFALKLQRWVFHPIQCDEKMDTHDQWAIFTGTRGPNRKQVYINETHEAFGSTIVKRACGPQSHANLCNEYKVLQMLNAEAKNPHFIVPKCYAYDNDTLFMEKLNATKSAIDFSYMHGKAINGLNKINTGVVSLERWLSSIDIKVKLGSAKGDFPISFLNQLNKLYISLDREKQIKIGMAHGDFTPWNTFMSHDKLAIIDWELAKLNMPLGFDFFHFHVQSGIMLYRKNWHEIIHDIKSALTPEMRVLLFREEGESVDTYLKLYLLYHITYHLDLYSAQAKWHDQVYWQIEVWSDALLSLQGEEKMRENFIYAVFDHLHYIEYAMLKSGSTHPADKSECGDIDIVMKKEDCKKLYKRLKSNVLVKSISLQKKSFMYGLRIRLVNDEWVFLDLIWQVRHKALVFMNVEKILASAYLNKHGIKVVNDSATAFYIQYFYKLNNAPIPDRYANDHRLKEFFTNNEDVNELRNRAENKGFSWIKNVWNYFIDSVKMVIASKGYIITFSGVDGAGKSTIIDEVKDHIDKVWRKPVVVLRHRPSILPILSAYVHGKKKAEALSVSKLPRTGANSSVFSSFSRWLYYLSDYVLGHMYLQWKYLRRGYVVIYDRYYFDFICDAKRTNIVLPKRLLTLGLNLVAKPDFNFFLYASPEVILARKQELDGKVIKDLTYDYFKCFSNCSEKYGSKIFLPIENIDKVETMNIIKSTIKNII